MTSSTPVPGRHTGPRPSGATAVDLTSREPAEPTIGQLVANASRDASTLIQNEIALAKAEVKVSVKNGGLAVAMFGAAAFLMLLAMVMLSVAIAYFIHMTGLRLAWCFLIVFGFYVLVAALLGFVGYRKVRKVRPPEHAIEQAKQTKDALLTRH